MGMPRTSTVVLLIAALPDAVIKFCLVCLVCGLLLLKLLLVFGASVLAHDGPDPLFRWRFDGDAVRLQDQANRHVVARLGPNAKLVGPSRMLASEYGGALFFEGG